MAPPSSAAKKNASAKKAPAAAAATADAAAAQQASSSGAAAATSAPKAPGNNVFLRGVRAFRTFEPRQFLHKHPTRIYMAVAGFGVIAANVLQYRRMRSIYPDYDKYAKIQGAQYSEAKTQELCDVMRYNNMVDTMRHDINTRTGKH
jgi:hypothetical protein